MNEELTKFRTLLLTDKEFQQELKTASENYTGDMTEEELFRNVLSPLAAKYGITSTFEDFKKYVEDLNDRELSSDEISQIAGGGTKGVGASACWGIGIGLGGMEEDGEGTDMKGFCVVLGAGETGACAGNGSSTGM